MIVINESMARQHFGWGDPIGQRISLGTVPDPSSPWMEVVGVVADVRQAPDADAKSEMYVPYGQYPDPVLRRLYSNVTVVLKTSGPPAELASAMRDVVREVDPNQPVANVRTMDDVLSAAVTQPRFRTLLFGLFAAIASHAGGHRGLRPARARRRAAAERVRRAAWRSARRRHSVLRLVLMEGLALAMTGVVTGNDRCGCGRARARERALRRQPVGSVRVGGLDRHVAVRVASGELAAGTACGAHRSGHRLAYDITWGERCDVGRAFRPAGQRSSRRG